MKTMNSRWIPALVVFFFAACTSSYTPEDGGDEVLPDGEDGGLEAGDGEGGCINAYPGQVLITEIMANPRAAPGEPGRFIELYNTSFEILQMQGWILNDGVSEVEIALGGQAEFLPQTHLVIAFEADPQQNGGLEPDLVISGIDSARGFLVIRSGETEVDRVAFSGAAWSIPAGASLSLDPDKYDLTQNNLAENWCPGTEAYGDGDLGTPGETNTACVPPECGNSETEHPEHCDDGKNGDDLDGCRDDCTYTCDDPKIDCPDTAGDCLSFTCEPNPLGQVCSTQVDGDGSPCDNQSGLPGDYCKAGGCIEPVCGDDITGPLEQCDDGNNEDGDGCSAICEFELCGNAEPDGEEQCDDGRNGDDLDGCRDDCKYTCFIPALDCPDTMGDCLSFSCTPNSLGQVCSSQVDVDGTPCDNSTGPAGDYCVAGVCGDPVCGDGIEGPLEACDDGDFDACDGCLPTCELHDNFCGDGFTCPPEECDDSNDQTGDGCAPGCTVEGGTCPPDMVMIPVAQPFCMDIYEASRADASATEMGVDVNKAVSQAGVIPWYVNPMSDRIFEQFQAACRNAGKRICEMDEFFTACSQDGQNLYVFGNTFDREICNCVDTFCDDYCIDHGIDPCSTADNCGYTYYCFHAVPTGEFTGCTNAYGTFDINGNVWEIVPSDTDLRGYEVRGGAFNCAGASARLQCTFNAGWTALFAGFRCCRDY